MTEPGTESVPGSDFYILDAENTMDLELLSNIADQYEKLVDTNSLKWLPVDKSTLDQTTVLYLETILEPSGLQYWIADQRLEQTVLFLVDHPVIKYLHHDPTTELHMWVGSGFKVALDNNWVLLTLDGLARLIPSNIRRPRRLMDGIFELLRRGY